MKNSYSLKIINLDSIDSTNNYAFSLAKKDNRETIVVKAKSQTIGKGRLGREWVSPEGNLYFSIILRPKNNLSEVAFLPLFFSLGVCNALDDLIKLKIKWPNDVICQGKKIAGVLVEAQTQGERLDYVIAGIGININARKEQIPQTATSMYLENKKEYSVDDLFSKILIKILDLYNRFKDGNIKELFDQAYEFLEDKTPLKDMHSQKSDLVLNNEDISNLINLR